MALATVARSMTTQHSLRKGSREEVIALPEIIRQGSENNFKIMGPLCTATVETLQVWLLRYFIGSGQSVLWEIDLSRVISQES